MIEAIDSVVAIGVEGVGVGVSVDSVVVVGSVLATVALVTFLIHSTLIDVLLDVHSQI